MSQMMQTVLLPGFISPAGSQSNSKITHSTSGRGGTDGSSISIIITAQADEDATNSVPFTGPSAECAVGALPASSGAEDATTISSKDMAALSLGEAPTAADAADCIPDSADDETEAIGEKLRRE